MFPKQVLLGPFQRPRGIQNERRNFHGAHFSSCLLRRVRSGGELGLAASLRGGAEKSEPHSRTGPARLKNGNVDFLADKAEPSPQDHKRRLEIARGQNSFRGASRLLGQPDSDLNSCSAPA